MKLKTEKKNSGLNEYRYMCTPGIAEVVGSNPVQA